MTDAQPHAVPALTCNGERVALADLPPAPTVAALLEARWGAPRPAGVAVAVDGEVVPREAWATTPVRAGGVVDVVTAVQGG